MAGEQFKERGTIQGEGNNTMTGKTIQWQENNSRRGEHYKERETIQ